MVGGMVGEMSGCVYYTAGLLEIHTRYFTGHTRYFDQQNKLKFMEWNEIMKLSLEKR
jgi:hypothetical protein